MSSPATVPCSLAVRHSPSDKQIFLPCESTLPLSSLTPSHPCCCPLPSHSTFPTSIIPVLSSCFSHLARSPRFSRLTSLLPPHLASPASPRFSRLTSLLPGPKEQHEHEGDDEGGAADGDGHDGAHGPWKTPMPLPPFPSPTPPPSPPFPSPSSTHFRPPSSLNDSRAGP
ncbi:unnamed protein product [Closterium sp. NIES-54]